MRTEVFPIAKLKGNDAQTSASLTLGYTENYFVVFLNT